MKHMGLFGGARPRSVEDRGSGRPALQAALDIGSSKIACFIGRAEGEGVRVLGVGHQSSRGVRCGAIVDPDEAETGIRAAVQQAERMAGEAVASVTVNLSVGQPRSHRIVVEGPLSGREVQDRDLRRLLTEALNQFHEPDRVVAHAIPLSWSVDEDRGVRDPRGMFGRMLGVEMHIVTVAAGPLRNLAACVERCRLDIRAVAATPYASGLSALVEDERNLGALIIDMGGGTTSVAAFAEGALAYIDVIPVGGMHVTTDIARGLSTPVASAERIKTVFGSVLESPDDDQELIPTPQIGEEEYGGVNHTPRSMLTQIIKPRLEETFEIVRERLRTAAVDRASGRRCVLVGGAAQLPGVRELAARILEKQVRIGKPERVHGLG
ncbi:MAG TPA: cell division protein FtsA, partial [Myxococcota bacterium]|nr:cell division protein FtsA [Myxococcota bacterium]